jgi:hypothetical protein
MPALPALKRGGFPADNKSTRRRSGECFCRGCDEGSCSLHSTSFCYYGYAVLKYSGMDKLNQIFNIVVDTQSQVSDLTSRTEHIEDIINKTYNRFDEFMTIVNRYESEIAAIRMKYERLEGRMDALERKFAA